MLLFHGGHLAGGFLGVDAFFVLSGFLITSLLLAEARDRGGIALGAFWVRRARRLLPALACVLAAVALYARGAREARRARDDPRRRARDDRVLRELAGDLREPRLLVALPEPVAARPHVEPRDRGAVLPRVAVAGRRPSCAGAAAAIAAQRVLVASVALAIVSLAWMLVIFDPANPSRVYYGTDTRVASILVGAALAAWLALRGPVRSRRCARRARGGRDRLRSCCSRSRGRDCSGSSDILYRGGLFACAVATVVVIAAAVHPRPGPSAGCSRSGRCARSGSSATACISGTGRSTSCSTSRVRTSTGWPLLARSRRA